METFTKMAVVKDTTPQGDAGPGTFEVILSAPTVDRDNEKLAAGALEPLPDWINFDVDHGMSVRTTVGSGTPVYNDDGQLVVKGTYASTPLAQETRTLVNEGHIRFTSVAFMNPVRTKAKDGVVEISKAELLNGTFAAVPANREAAILSSKTTDAKAGARNSKKDSELIQAILDAAVQLGAALPDSDGEAGTHTSVEQDVKTVGEARFRKHFEPADAKAVQGSYEAIQRQLRRAVEERFTPTGPEADDWSYVFVYATFPDHVVFTVCNRGEYATWSAPYEVATDGAVTFGETTAVDIVEIVVPNADETGSESVSESTAADAETVTAAVSTQDAAAKAEQEQAAAAFRIRRMRAKNGRAPATAIP